MANGEKKTAASFYRPGSTAGDGQKIAILTPMGWPRDEATGTVQHLLALAKALEGEYTINLVTSESNSSGHLLSTEGQRWKRDRSLERFTCTKRRLGPPKDFARLLRHTRHDLLLLNGFFDREFTIPALIMRKLGWIPRGPTLLSPHGEFSPGALCLKPKRKRTYLKLVRTLGLLSDVWLHATSPEEAKDFRQAFPFSRGILVAPIVRTLCRMQPPREILSDRIKLTILGRVDRVKNVDYAIEVLSAVRTQVCFDIYGPITDQKYWEKCKQSIAKLPPNVEVRYLGSIPNSEVNRTLSSYDLFFLPTRGENFGQAIFDAFEAGLPVLISDTTPWRDLEHLEAGWSLPLSDPSAFASVIERITQMNSAERTRLRLGARRVAERYVNNDELAGSYRQMFRHVIAGTTDNAPAVLRDN
jgi:glycosyltransferase involved in cell wall biosynthesis